MLCLLYISSLRVDGFRNLVGSDLIFSPGLNWFFGSNGSGKTSVLEAIYHLGYGRSFRSSEAKKVIAEGEKEFVVFAKVVHSVANERVKLGLVKAATSNPVLRVNGFDVRGYAEFVKFCPIQLFSPDSASRLLGSPSARRMCFDWLLFHVEHQFGSLASRYRKVIKQRNSLLRSNSGRISPAMDRELIYWNEQVCNLASKINSVRESYFELFNSQLKEELAAFGLDASNLSLAYYSGWPNGLSIEKSLADSYHKDVKLCVTSCGAHKADIRIQVGTRSVLDVWSNGMLRMLTCAVQLTLCKLLFSLAGKASICLVDDLTAELDSVNQAMLLRRLYDTDFQIFITQISKVDGAFASFYDSTSEQKKGKMFHVKQGSITEETT